MISLRKAGAGQREGFFKSYKAIGEYLAQHGETATYWARPLNISTIAGLKEIHVIKHASDDIEIEMEGSNY